MTLRDDSSRAAARLPPSRIDRRTAQRERARRVRRRRIVAVVTLIGLVSAIALLLSGGSAAPPRAKRAASAAVSAGASEPQTATAPAPATATSPAAASSAPAPGTLPQTHAFPSAQSAAFRSRMASLWAGVTSNSTDRALPAFFPQSAYVQVKEEGAPGADWTERLLHDYSLDLAAAHALLGSNPGGAQLVEVRAVSGYGHWVEPGVCSNRVGYYEMPNARVVYRQNGQLASFGIASMISWRGEWYVVHLGAVVREGEGGVTDEPTSGPGSSAPSSTC